MSMENFEYWSPTRFIFGKNTQEQTGQLVKDFGGKRVLLHYGSGSVVRSGLLDQVKRSLEAQGIFFVELGGVQPNPVDTLVYQGITLARQEKIDFILAVGGGSTIDSAKAIAAGIPYEGDFWDMYDHDVPVGDVLPLGVVLTIPAAGSEGSTGSVITKEEGLLKRSAGSVRMKPRFAVMNPELTYTLPAYQTACGVTDIMAHVFERYFSPTTGVDLTDRLCESVIATIVHNTPIALKDPTNYDARANIMWAGMIAHNDLVGVGRIDDWSTHQIEHELSALYDVAHGAGLAVIFPAWMRHQYKHDPRLFAQIAVRVFGCKMDENNLEKTALEGIEKFEKFLQSIGMPLNFSQLGARAEDIPLMVQKVKHNNGKKMGYFKPLTDDEIEAIFVSVSK